MKTIFERVIFYWGFDAKKHCLGGDFAEKQVNAMSNWELLQAISDAIANQEGERNAD